MVLPAGRPSLRWSGRVFVEYVQGATLLVVVPENRPRLAVRSYLRSRRSVALV